MFFTESTTHTHNYICSCAKIHAQFYSFGLFCGNCGELLEITPQLSTQQFARVLSKKLSITSERYSKRNREREDYPTWNTNFWLRQYNSNSKFDFPQWKLTWDGFVGACQFDIWGIATGRKLSEFRKSFYKFHIFFQKWGARLYIEARQWTEIRKH